MTGGFPSPQHDHAACVAQALATARVLCAERGVRLTEARRRVLEAVWASHAPVGAYDIVEALAEGGRRTTPMTVYRILDFLVDQGLVHRIRSRRAYVGCARPDTPHEAQFLICRDCGAVGKISDAGIMDAIRRRAARDGFSVASATVEIEGLCPHCREKGEQDA